jgi:hypothetical protein
MESWTKQEEHNKARQGENSQKETREKQNLNTYIKQK